MEDIISKLIITVSIILLIFCLYMLYNENKNYEEYGEKVGIIIDREYIPMQTIQKEINNTIVPYIEPAKYRFKIQKEVNEETKSIWIYVTEAEYNNYGIEDYYGISQ